MASRVIEGNIMERYTYIISKYIRGEINLEQAAEILMEFAPNKKGIIKVLKETPRRNIIQLKKYKKLKKRRVIC